MSQNENIKKSFWQNISSKTGFLLGLVSGIAFISTIGFLILLIIIGGKININQQTNAGKVAGIESNTNQQPFQQDNNKNQVGDFKPVSKEDHIRGKENAPITIIEYSDTECPFCKRFHSTLKQLIETYPDKVKWVYRHFPLSSLHPKAPKEAEALECAGEQGRFWEYTDRLFEITPSNNKLDPEQLPEIAKEIGLNVEKFKNCLDSGKYSQKVQEQYKDAINAGGQGTPFSILIDPHGNAQPIHGAQNFNQLKQIIESF